MHQSSQRDNVVFPLPVMRHRPRNLTTTVTHISVGPQQMVPVQLSGVVGVFGKVQQDFAEAVDGRVLDKDIMQAAVNPLQTVFGVRICLVRVNRWYRLGEHRLRQGLLIDLLEPDLGVFGQFREIGGVERGYDGHCGEEGGYACGIGVVGGEVVEEGGEVGLGGRGGGRGGCWSWWGGFGCWFGGWGGGWFGCWFGCRGGGWFGCWGWFGGWGGCWGWFG